MIQYQIYTNPTISLYPFANTILVQVGFQGLTGVIPNYLRGRLPRFPYLAFHNSYFFLLALLHVKTPSFAYPHCWSVGV